MKAILHNKKSQPYKLQLVEVQKPTPKDNEILLKVACASINAADYRSMNMGIIPKKKIFGSAVAGTIESVGKEVQKFKVGDRVVGDLSDFGFGGLAEFVAAPEKAFALIYSNTSFEDSVTLPVAATTALKAVRDKGEIQAGQKVLIVGSSGGVGTFALQLSKYFNAEVTAVCSSKNIDQTKSLGANKVIDYTKTDFTKESERYDLIIAVNGNYSLLGYQRILTSKGTLVMVGGKLAQIFKTMLFGWLLSFGGKKMKILSAKADSKDLEFVSKLMDEGSIKAVIHKRYPLDKTPEAMVDIGKGHSPGKVVVII